MRAFFCACVCARVSLRACVSVDACAHLTDNGGLEVLVVPDPLVTLRARKIQTPVPDKQRKGVVRGVIEIVRDSDWFFCFVCLF